MVSLKTSLKRFTSIILAVLMLISVMTVAGVSVSAATIEEVASGADTVYFDLSGAYVGDEDYFAWVWDGATPNVWKKLNLDKMIELGIIEDIPE